MQLVSPSVKYQQSFLQAMKEYQVEGRYTELSIDDLEKTLRNMYIL